MHIHGIDRGGLAIEPPGLILITLFDPVPFPVVRNSHPAFVDLRGVDCAGHSRRGKPLLRRFDIRRGDEKLAVDLPRHLGTRMANPIAIGLAHQLQHFDPVFGPLGHAPVVGAAVEDRATVVASADERDVGDVDRAVDDNDVLASREDVVTDDRCAKIPVFTEVICRGADVVVAVDPDADAGVGVKIDLRGERRPADVIVALAPGNPGRPPLVIGPPDPAEILQADPPAVVIRDRSKIFIGDPGPARIGVSPIAVGVRPPIGIDPPRLPAIAVVVDVHPVPVGLEAVVEIREGDTRRGLPGQNAHAQKRQQGRQQQGFDFHRRGCC